MTMRMTARDLLYMEADIGRGAEVEVAIDKLGVSFMASIRGRGPQGTLSAAYMLSHHHIFYLNDEVSPLPEIASQLRKKFQKEMYQDSE